MDASLSAPAATHRRPSLSAAAGWAVVVLVLLGQYLLFRGYVERELAWGYPRMWDQAALLGKSYAAHVSWQREGFLAGLASAWTQRLPTGSLALFESAAFLQLLGGSRLSALTLNFLHYALLQIALVATLRRMAQGWSAAALGLGLLLSLRSPSGWGGLFDFRLDFMAMCLQGLWLCLALRGDTLARTRPAAAAGAVAAVLALLRYITFAYTWATLSAFAALEWLSGRRAVRLDPRVRGAALVLGVVSLAAVPFLWLSRAQLRAYYWVGHVEKGDALARWAGITNRLDGWLYYPRSLRDDHLGPAGLALFALTVAVSGGLWWLTRRRPPLAHDPLAPDLGAAARLLACATLCPLVVLSLDTAKSQIVASLVLPGLVLLATLPAAALLRRGVGGRALPGLAALVLVAGCAHAAAWLAGPGPLNAEAADSREITRLHETLARVAEERGWPRPLVLVDSSEEYSLRWNTTVVGYERSGALIEPRYPLGGTRFNAVAEDQLRRAIGSIQLTVVAREGAAAGPPLPPFDASMAQLRPLVLAICEREFVSAGHFLIHGREVGLFVRPPGWAAPAPEGRP